VFLAQLAGPAGLVIAFEPQRIVYQILCGNLAINSIPNVLCFQEAVGSQLGQIIVPNLDYGQEGNFGGLALGGYQQGEPVRVITLDSLNLDRCRFIKIDVEGMEQDVLQGAVATIARHRPLMYVENDRQEKSAGLVSYINSLGYKMFWHLPPIFDPNNYRGNSQNVFGHVVSVNMLCVPSEVPYDVKNFVPVEAPAST
jgi:FkbM family methyltransferase